MVNAENPIIGVPFECHIFVCIKIVCKLLVFLPPDFGLKSPQDNLWDGYGWALLCHAALSGRRGCFPFSKGRRIRAVDLTLKTCSGDGFAVSRYAHEHIHRVLRDGIESARLRYHLRDQQKRLHHHPTKFQLKDAELEIKNVRRVMESNRGKLATLVHAEKFPSATQTAN